MRCVDLPAASILLVGLRKDPCSDAAAENKMRSIRFVSGFTTAAAQHALPDTGLVSYGEVVEAGSRICGAVQIPLIGDGDTGYGNPPS